MSIFIEHRKKQMTAVLYFYISREKCAVQNSKTVVE